MTAIRRHPMPQALRIQGNPRACVLTEPMFGVPFNMVTRSCR